MKNLLYIFIASFLALGVSSCTDDNYTYVNPNVSSDFSAEYSATGPFVLDKDNSDAEVFVVTWTEPSDFGFDAVPYYRVAVDLSTGDFSSPQLTTPVTDMSHSFTNKEINTMAIALGATPGEEVDLVFKVQVLLGQGSSFTAVGATTAQTITVTPYSSVLDLSTTWGIVGSGYNNWGATPDAPFYQTGTDGVYVAYVDLVDGEIKFRENNKWDNNYGGTDGALEADGANIAVTAGSYKVTINFNNSSYTIEPFSLGIVGSGYNDWGATPDFKLEYDPYSDTFKGIVTLVDGEIKFRLNNEWSDDWGGENGTLVSGGANIAVTAGNYIVTVDLNNNEYSLEAIDNIWGIVGSAYNDWGATPDAAMTRDWSQPDKEIWVINGVSLVVGEMKIRANNDWTSAYGGDSLNGNVSLDGGNIPVSEAGEYNMVLDLSSSPATLTSVKQ